VEFFSPGHLIVLAIVALVLFFGWKQLPDMSRSLGRSLRIFKTEIKGMAEDDSARNAHKDSAALPEAPPAAAANPAPAPTPSTAQPAATSPGAPSDTSSKAAPQ
jgi:sec-independent protein translocase protein TatA